MRRRLEVSDDTDLAKDFSVSHLAVEASDARNQDTSFCVGRRESASSAAVFRWLRKCHFRVQSFRRHLQSQSRARSRASNTHTHPTPSSAVPESAPAPRGPVRHETRDDKMGTLAAIAAPFAGEAVAARRPRPRARAPRAPRAAPRLRRCVLNLRFLRVSLLLPVHLRVHLTRRTTSSDTFAHALTIAIFSPRRAIRCTNSVMPLRPPPSPVAGWALRPPRWRWAFRPRPRPRWRCRA